jgi:hypothetical protein
MVGMDREAVIAADTASGMHSKTRPIQPADCTTQLLLGMLLEDSLLSMLLEDSLLSMLLEDSLLSMLLEDSLPWKVHGIAFYCIPHSSWKGGTLPSPIQKLRMHILQVTKQYCNKYCKVLQ